MRERSPDLSNAAPALAPQQTPAVADDAAKRQSRHQIDGEFARSYRLPGKRPLDLSADHEKKGEWPAQVAEYLAEEFGCDRARLTVTQNGYGFSGAPVFEVKEDNRAIGVFKVFPNPKMAQVEVDMLRKLRAQAIPGMKVVEERGMGTASLRGKVAGTLFMQCAEGRVLIDDMFSLPSAGDARRAGAIAQLGKKFTAVGRALAGMHGTFETGKLLTPDEQLDAAKWTLQDRLPSLKEALGEHLVAAEARIKQLMEESAKHPLPATVTHGDAHAGNFSVTDDMQVTTFDVSTLRYGMNAQGKGNAPGANDLGRFIQALGYRSFSDEERDQLGQQFLQGYLAAVKQKPADFSAAITLARIDAEMVFLRGWMKDVAALRAQVAAGDQSPTTKRRLAEVEAHVGPSQQRLLKLLGIGGAA